MTTDLREHLDRLDTALAAATDGRWYVGETALGSGLAMYSDADSRPGIGQCFMPADAALIVAAVNALPKLLAAVRAAADLADELAAKCPPGEWGDGGIDDAIQADTGRAFLRILAAALTEGDPA